MFWFWIIALHFVDLSLSDAKRAVLWESKGWRGNESTPPPKSTPPPEFRLKDFLSTHFCPSARLYAIHTLFLKIVVGRIDSLTADDVAGWTKTDFEFSDSESAAILKQDIVGSTVVGVVAKHLKEGRGDNGSRIRCREYSTLGLASHCEYERSLCVGPDFKFVIIDDSKVPGSGLPQYNVADKHPKNSLDIGQFLVARKGTNQGTPFRAFIEGVYMSSDFLERGDIAWIKDFSFIINRDDGCSKNIFHVAASSLTGWHYLLHEHNWGNETFDYLHSDCTAFKNIVTFCSE